MAKNFTKYYLKRYRGRLALFITFSILSILFTIGTVLSLSDFLRLLFDTSSESHTGNQYNIIYQWIDKLYVWLIAFGKHKAIIYFSLLLFGLYLMKNVFSYFASFTIFSFRSKVMRDIRNDFFQKILRLPIGYFSRTRKGDIITRFGDDVSQYDEYILKSIQQLIISISSIILYLAILLYTNVKLTGFVFILLPVAALVISRITKTLRKNSTVLQQKTSFLMSMTEETLGGIRIIKSHNAIEFSNKRFQQFNNSYTRLKNSIYRRVDMASPISDFLGNTIVMCILIFGSSLTLQGGTGFTAEIFITYIILFVLIINPAKDLSTAISQIKKGQASTERIQEILDYPEVKMESDNPLPINSFSDSIVFDNVSFAYESNTETVLSDVSFEIKKGQTVALVGSSGGGKSTVINLLVRFYDPSIGEIRLDGNSIRSYSLTDYRKLIGVVSQDTILFNGSISENIAFGKPDATEEEIINAAKIANAHEFIMQTDDGYQTHIGDYGSKLSGGQRQRISIARSILQNPPILILDEATSALDTESEYLVQEALNKAAENRTTLAIAHRLSTVIHADLILVISNGKIVQRGTHQTLFNEEGLYRKLCTMQALQ